jgi:hypothetical protein
MKAVDRFPCAIAASMAPHAANGEWQIDDAVLCCEADGGLVLVSFRNGNYYGMNAVGQRIWRGIVEGLTTNEIAASLAGSAGRPVDETSIRQAVESFTRDLASRRLIRRRIAPPHIESVTSTARMCLWVCRRRILVARSGASHPPQ